MPKFPTICASLALTAFLCQSSAAQHFDLTQKNWSGTNHSDSQAILLKPASFEEDGALVFSDGNFVDVPSLSENDLPSGSFTIEAHVALTRGTKWGNIVGYMQDNGNYERGFSLGYNESAFTVWISTGGSLISAVAEEPFILGEWYHLLATYDGQKLKLVVNGDLAATVDAPGKVAYPDQAQFTIGAYRDKDELYPMEGKLRSVSLSKKATVIKSSGSDFTIRPAVQFITPSSASIRWGRHPAGGTVTFGKSKPLREKISTEENHIVLENLEPRTIYYYKLNGGKTHAFNTALNFTTPKIKPLAASQLLSKTKFRKGYCLTFGADAALAEEIAANSDFTVIGIDTDPAKVAAARQTLYKKKLYGTRISMMHVDSYEQLPFTDGFANLVIAGSSSAEIKRITTPGRATAIIAGEAFDAPEPTGHGDWSHQYGDPGNSANSGETLAGARSTAEFSVRWFGRPGADFGLDRQSRMPAPLSIGGRLFHQGMDRLVALDANNGAVLWGLDIPDVRRLNMPRDASNWCADKKHLYLAVKQRAWVIDAENGNTKTSLTVPGDDPDLDWGYIAHEGDRLFGSGVRPDSGYTSFWTSRAWFDGKAGSFGTGKVCSESIFAYSMKNAKPVWNYRDGLIINPTIAVKSGRVFFIESRNPELKKQTNRQVNSPELWKDQFLVALDAVNGKKLWEQSIDLEDGTISYYLQATEETVIITSSNTQFHFYAYAAADGKLLWNRSNAWAANHHSGHIQHPVILDNTLYVSPNGYSMTDGEIVTTKVGAREGCHTYIGAGDTLIYRGAGRVVSIWDRHSETVSNWPRLRPSCWLSFIPANGMLLLPEGGGGCSCGGWMETSLGFAPITKSQ
ncbi:MAG: outer membrane protein assembly factor BamB [Verrucomicrobiales bacterium]|jgi:outer membrane protein assembly factor BamB